MILGLGAKKTERRTHCPAEEEFARENRTSGTNPPGPGPLVPLRCCVLSTMSNIEPMDDSIDDENIVRTNCVEIKLELSQTALPMAFLMHWR